MKTLLHKAVDRGQGDYGWLSTRYSFSFADWYDESRMGFGALRVLNDDVIVGGAGFPTHGHRDMEIITIVTEGAVAHKDNAGGNGVVRAGEVQVMSAGKGVLHSEYNASEHDNLSLFFSFGYFQIKEELLHDMIKKILILLNIAKGCFLL